MYLVLITVLILLVFTVLKFVLEHIKIDRQLKTFALPSGLPLIGHLHWFQDVSNHHEALFRVVKKFGGLVKLNLIYGIPFAVVTDREFLSFLLGTKNILNKNYDYKMLYRWLGEGLLTSSRERWEKMRRVLTPAFHVQLLEKYVDIFNSTSDVLIEKLKEQAGKVSFDVHPFITLCSLDIISESVMGTKINAQSNACSDYVKSVKEMCRILLHRSQNPLKYFMIFYIFTKDYWKERKAVKYLHGFTNSVIQKRKIELSNRKMNDEVNINQKPSLLDLILNTTVDGKPLSDEEIRQEVDTFMFAGHDTSAAAISFTLYCLSTHKDVQENVVNELRSIFNGDKNKNITYKDLQDMKYLHMVVKESLRLYPPVPVFSRKPDKDTVYGENIVSTKLSLTVFAYGVHRDENNYSDPEKFDPDRFITESDIKPYTYIPFSMGPRNCIGQKFALLEIKAIISKILRNYEILPVEGYKPQLVPLVVLQSSNGLLIRLKEREF